MDPTRIAEINTALQKRGAEEVRGPERAALVTELSRLLGAGSQPSETLAPEKKERVDEIAGQLREHAAGTRDIDVFERNALAREASDILLAAGESEGAAP